MRFPFLFCLVFLTGCGIFTDPESVSLQRPGADLDAGVDLRSEIDDTRITLPDAGDDADVISVPETCGDGLLQPDEVCDPRLPDTSPGACPITCDDGTACTTDALVGSPLTCDAACRAEPITACQNNDGCCPADCSPSDDTDCDENAVCGDGVLTGAETCDPGLADNDPRRCVSDAAACPPLTCQSARLLGAPQNCDAECAYVQIRSCVSEDGCCPAGCDESNDDDCASLCGNGIIEPGEGCDGNCPADCDDGDACTQNILSGSAQTCDASCSTAEITMCTDGDGCCPAGCDSGNDDDCSPSCGNDVLDPGETCDPPGSCPASCDDGQACTTDTRTGSNSNCNVVCTHSNITTCRATPDGCCPSTCNANNDGDCAPQCGNQIVELGETCDGNCPASCDDANVCTTDGSTGDAASCTLTCANAPISMCVSGDGCCPGGCNAINDDDCGAVCGNGITEPPERCDGTCPVSCDDGNACTVDLRNGSAAQCDVLCTHLFVASCVDGDGCCPSGCNANTDSDCSPSCGNGVVEGNETCDGNCPTSSTCTAQHPCTQLSGSAAQCNAACTTVPGCQLCEIGGTCGCAAGQLCNQFCEPGNGLGCNKSCNPYAYCEAWVGEFSFCDTSSGMCKVCRFQCQPAMICTDTGCLVPPRCDLSPQPDVWCQLYGVGNKCAAGQCI